MNLNEQRVYAVQPQKTQKDIKILTPNEALMYNLRGIKLVDMTKLHDLTPNHVRMSRKTCPMKGIDYGTLFGRATAEA
jgi:hypothetical protein